jgi:hypothetical protein
VFCCTFFMLFLAATNDRNHAVSPPNNIKLRPHSILYYFVYFASYLFLSMLSFGLWWTTSWTHVCHVTYQTVGHIHSHTFKHVMDVSHGSMADMNLQIVLRPTCVILSLLASLWWYWMPHATHQNMRDIHVHVFPILGWMSHMLPWLPWLMLVMCSIKTSNSSMVQV